VKSCGKCSKRGEKKKKKPFLSHIFLPQNTCGKFAARGGGLRQLPQGLPPCGEGLPQGGGQASPTSRMRGFTR